MTAGLTVFCSTLYGREQAGGFVEVRTRRARGGMDQRWFELHDQDGLARHIEARGPHTDVYIGVAPRVRREGTKHAVERVHVLWADCDDLDSLAALDAFRPPPTLVIGSGGGYHAYWALADAAPPHLAEVGCKRLSAALGSDSRVCDAARVMRPPGTFNHKPQRLADGKPVPVYVHDRRLDIERYAYAEVVGACPELGDPAPRHGSWGPGVHDPAPRRGSWAPGVHQDVLRQIPPETYVELLTGCEVGRNRKVCCPFHPDSDPSLHVYEEPEHGWFCFGCRRGGSIYDFGAALYGITPRGAGFRELRRRLAADLLARAGT
jgi:hypothetical protein